MVMSLLEKCVFLWFLKQIKAKMAMTGWAIWDLEGSHVHGMEWKLESCVYSCRDLEQSGHREPD